MKVLISTPCYNNQLDARMVIEFIKIIQSCNRKGIALNWDCPSSPMLAYNRNQSVFTAIQEGYDWVLFWDSDVAVTTPDFLQQLLDEAYKDNISILGVPVRLKKQNEIVWNYGIKGNDGIYENGKEWLPDGVFRVDVIGTGLLLVKTEVFKKISQPWFHFEDTFGPDHIGFFPEDWYFCEKATKAGYTIWADPTIKTIHYGSYPYQ